MKIFKFLKRIICDSTKIDNIRKFKIFGITVYSKEVVYNTNDRIQSFVFGLIKTVRTRDIYTTDSYKKIQILGLNLLSREIKKNDILWKFFGITIKRDNLYNKFKRKYLKYFDKKYDDIYLLNANSGEAYLFLTYCLDACIKKYGSKMPLLVATKPYHTELIKMICPDIDYVYIKPFSMFVKSDTVYFKIDNFRFFQAFSNKHFLQVEIDIKNDENAHYFKSILNEFDLTQHDIQMRKTLEIMSSVNSMLEKVKNINLNLDKFVLVAPEANSCELLDNKYWIDLINQYSNDGYDVFVNFAGEEVDLTGATFKTCFLTYSEIFSLAKKAKKIIMLRSGLSELLTQTGVPMEVLYTKFGNRILFNSMEIEQVKRGFELTKLPYLEISICEKIIKKQRKNKQNLAPKLNQIDAKKTYLFGIFYYKQNRSTNEKEFRLLGLPIWRKKFKRGKERYYFCGIAYFKKSSRKYLYKTILKNIDKKYKNIYIHFNCSGETYLFLSYIKPTEDSIFVATKKYHIDLCKMLHPNIACIYLPNILNLRASDNVYKENYKDKNFYNVLPFDHFRILEEKIKKGLEVHYCKEICKTIGVEYSTKALLPFISEDIKKSALNKANRIGLNIDNFIFLCPESQSNEDPPNDFWINLVEDLYNSGYDVFLNVLNQNPKFGTAKSCYLTFAEAYYIASLSKKIIGLRSGFIEPLSSIKNIPITCYYTDFKDRGLLSALDKHKVLKGFSLKYLPNVNINNIREVLINECL